MAEITQNFAGSGIIYNETPGGNRYLEVTLPNGKVLNNVLGWDNELWDVQLGLPQNQDPATQQSLNSLKAGARQIGDSLSKQFEAQALETQQPEPEPEPAVATPVNIERPTPVDPDEDGAAEQAEEAAGGAGPGDEPVAENPNTNRGLTSAQNSARTQATSQDQVNFDFNRDWRVRLRLLNTGDPSNKYLYHAEPAGILAPLKATDGVVFPYTPSLQVQYHAQYDTQDLIHNNYRSSMYRSSYVDNIQLSCEFTAQDTYEANYLLAVIHFFRSVTKMFYGNDENPSRGTPPPLCYLTGFGAFQFQNHPLAITNFAYSLPTDVDYIRATSNTTTMAGMNKSPSNISTSDPSNNRLNNIQPGGNPPAPAFEGRQTGGTVEPTYVPTRMNIQLTAIPIVSRNDNSNNFSLKDYATGKLLQGIKLERSGFW